MTPIPSVESGTRLQRQSTKIRSSQKSLLWFQIRTSLIFCIKKQVYVELDKVLEWLMREIE